MVAHEPFFGVPAYGEMPIYLGILFLAEIAWGLALGAYLLVARIRRRWGALRAVVGWGTIVVLTAATSHLAFRAVPQQSPLPAYSLIIAGSGIAVFAGTAVGGLFHLRRAAVLSAVSILMLLFVYSMGRGAGISYERLLRTRCESNIRAISTSFGSYWDEHGSLPSCADWERAVAKHKVYMPYTLWHPDGYYSCPARRPLGQHYRYNQRDWRRNEEVLIRCEHLAGTYLPAETLSLTVGGEIIKK